MLAALVAFASEVVRLDKVPYIHLLTPPDYPEWGAASAEPACAVGPDVGKAVQPAVTSVVSAWNGAALGCSQPDEQGNARAMQGD